jgi:hypothetical protein
METAAFPQVVWRERAHAARVFGATGHGKAGSKKRCREDEEAHGHEPTAAWTSGGGR